MAIKSFLTVFAMHLSKCASLPLASKLDAHSGLFASRLHPLRCPSASIAPHSGHTRWAQQAESPPSGIRSRRSFLSGVASFMSTLVALIVFTFFTRTLCIILYLYSWSAQLRYEVIMMTLRLGPHGPKRKSRHPSAMRPWTMLS